MKRLQATRSGTYAIFGMTNAGKSTLLNALLQERLAPVHRKPQMTRKNFLGYVTEGDAQMVFVDTPGFHEEDKQLNKELRKELSRALDDAEFLLVLIDVAAPPVPYFIKRLQDEIEKKECLFVFNKTDLPRAKWKIDPENFVANLRKKNRDPIFLVSALQGSGIAELKQHLLQRLPQGPWFFPEDSSTTASMRDLVVDWLMESVMEHLKDELPYEIYAVIENYRESPERDEIEAALIVNRDSQKGMVIGKGGEMLRKIGMTTRLRLEKFLDKKILLKIFVKVDPDWIKNSGKIREYYGYS